MAALAYYRKIALEFYTKFFTNRDNSESVIELLNSDLGEEFGIFLFNLEPLFAELIKPASRQLTAKIMIIPEKFSSQIQAEHLGSQLTGVRIYQRIY